MIRLAFSLLVLSAGVALAEGGPRAAEISALVTAVAAAGCVLNGSNQGAVLKAAGLTEDVAAGVVQVLLADGRMKPAGDQAMRLTTEGCR